MRLLRQPYSGREIPENTSAFTPITPSSERGGLLVPAILIALGGLFLLGSAGVIAPLSVQSVLSLCPLLLMLAGIQLLLGRDRPSLALGRQLGPLRSALRWCGRARTSRHSMSEATHRYKADHQR